MLATSAAAHNPALYVPKYEAIGTLVMKDKNPPKCAPLFSTATPILRKHDSTGHERKWNGKTCKGQLGTEQYTERYTQKQRNSRVREKKAKQSKTQRIEGSHVEYSREKRGNMCKSSSEDVRHKKAEVR